MPTDDRCVTIVPYFEVKDDALDEVKAELAKFVEKTRSEPKCLFYGFSFNGRRFHCREGYADGDGALEHLANIGEMLDAFLASGLVELTDLQVHGPEEELAKLRGPMAEFEPSFWVLELGFRRSSGRQEGRADRRR